MRGEYKLIGGESSKSSNWSATFALVVACVGSFMVVLAIRSGASINLEEVDIGAASDLDTFLLVDDSGSIGKENYRLMQDMLARFMTSGNASVKIRKESLNLARMLRLVDLVNLFMTKVGNHKGRPLQLTSL